MSCWSASTTLPTHIRGADTATPNAESASICTCCTSLTVRVISDGVPNCPTSRAEKSSTRRKTAERMSRPIAMAVRAPSDTAPTDAPNWTSARASMVVPVRVM